MNRSIYVAIAVACAACNKVEVKQDTPTATVSTIVKLYAAGDDSHWPEVVEPALVRGEARDTACVDVVMRQLQCDRALMETIQSHGRSRTPEGCPVNVSECTCGARGKTAAATATDFTSTRAHIGLNAEKLKPSSCRITDTTPLTRDSLKHLASDFFWDDTCSDVAPEDDFASVTLKCSEAEDTLVFILHNKSAKWGLVGFGSATKAVLAANAIGTSAEGAAKKRADDLNKDMK